VPERGARVLRMPTDIEVSVLTMGGLREPRADWTAAAREHVDAELDEFLAAHGESMVRYEYPDDAERTRHHVQVMKLHEVVGNAILLHKVKQGGSLGTPAVPLPTVEQGFDYSLGPDPGGLADEFDAEYALFVFLRDSHQSGGHVAASAAAAVLGVYLPGGGQVGFASLVDLRRGDLVWFGHLAREGGDLRDRSSAEEAVRQLLTDFPL
jgi:hypothetical protein